MFKTKTNNKRREGVKMVVNKQVNPHFNDFIFDWDYTYYLLVGAYGSSKSYHVALKIILKLMQKILQS